MTLGMLTRGFELLYAMKDFPPTCQVVPIHQRPDLFRECSGIINAEWPASEARRLRTFAESCDEFPTCLVLLEGERVIGHCKLSPIAGERRGSFLGSVVIDNSRRSRGFGSILLRGAEEYAALRGIEKVYLTTKGQEGFYLKNGYVVCDPVDVWNCALVPAPAVTSRPESRKFFGPPPPPMPPARSQHPTLRTSKTFMVKRL